MVVPARRSRHNGPRAPRLSQVAVVAVGVGIAAAAGHDVAWADTGHSDSSDNTSTHSSSGTGSGPRKSPDSHRHQRDRSSTTSKTPDAGSAAETAKPSATESNSTPPQHDSASRAARRIRSVDTVAAGSTQSGSSPHLAVNDPSVSIAPRAEHLCARGGPSDHGEAGRPGRRGHRTDLLEGGTNHLGDRVHLDHPRRLGDGCHHDTE
jgi:hypothetical protein